MSESVKSIFCKAIMSGIMIGIGGMVYLSAESKVLGAFLFSLGLFTIIRFGFALYTGKVGYIPEKKPKYILEVLTTFVGNVVGTGISALLIRLTRFGSDIQVKAAASMQLKMNDSIWSQLILGFFCGMLMYIAVHNAKISGADKNDASVLFGTVMPVMVFIFCGFNHSVADSFYMMAANPSVEGAVYVLTVAVGNACGGMTIPLVKKLFDKN